MQTVSIYKHLENNCIRFLFCYSKTRQYRRLKGHLPDQTLRLWQCFSCRGKHRDRVPGVALLPGPRDNSGLLLRHLGRRLVCHCVALRAVHGQSDVSGQNKQ